MQPPVNGDRPALTGASAARLFQLARGRERSSVGQDAYFPGIGPAIRTSILATARKQDQNLFGAFLAIAGPSPLQASSSRA